MLLALSAHASSSPRLLAPPPPRRSTHVAGTACGLTHGVASNCALCAVKVLGADGRGSWSKVIAGIEHAVADCATRPHRCVANLSLGGGRSAAVDAAVAGAVRNGVVMVVAAGNNDADACERSPAGEDSAVTVGATTRTDQRAGFSNYGACVDVYGPGAGITSAWSASGTAVNTMSGTSMASPRECRCCLWFVFELCLVAENARGSVPATVDGTLRHALHRCIR